MIYAGIGSRETPEPFCKVMSELAYEFARKGYILRSGNARGADYAFYTGASLAGGKMEIFIPSPDFGVVKGERAKQFISDIPLTAFGIAENFHPSWNRLSEFSKKLMARNVLQVLGKNLKEPADFIVCYTHDGLASGGTGQALRIATKYCIPIFNLAIKQDFNDLKQCTKITYYK